MSIYGPNFGGFPGGFGNFGYGGDVIANSLTAAFGGNPVPTGPLNVLQNYMAGDASLSGNQYAYAVLPQASPLSQLDMLFMQQQHMPPFGSSFGGGYGLGGGQFPFG